MPPSRSRAEAKKLDIATLAAIEEAARDTYDKIMRGLKPEMSFPVRSLSNVRYDRRKGFFDLGRARKTRTLTVNTVKTFAQSLKMMGLSKFMVETDDFATKRDAYYQSKNWGDARFKAQPESDEVMDDLEAMFSIYGLNREQMRFIPQEHGGAVAGELVVVDRDRDSGEKIEIDCTRFGSGAYSVPSFVEHLEFKTRASFVLAIETHGVFQRLQSHKFWQKHNCIIISMNGVPSRASRRFIRRLSESAQIPVFAFTDCDPYGFSNIYRTLKVGSGNAAHINKFFCVPEAKFLGVTPQDIIDWKLEDATHPLTEIDIKRAKDALKNDPFFETHKKWRSALEQQIKMGVRAEQQALAKWGLNFVMDEYLPAKLSNPKSFLP